MGFLDSMAEELDGIVQAGFKDVIDRVGSGAEEDALLRRFEANYGKLGLDDLLQVQNLAGHDPAETTPCKVCKIIAKKEQQLAEGE